MLALRRAHHLKDLRPHADDDSRRGFGAHVLAERRVQIGLMFRRDNQSPVSLPAAPPKVAPRLCGTVRLLLGLNYARLRGDFSINDLAPGV